MGLPQISLNLAEKMRAVMSTPPPAGNPTITRTGLLEYACPEPVEEGWANAAPVEAAASAAASSRIFMISPLGSQCFENVSGRPSRPA